MQNTGHLMLLSSIGAKPINEKTSSLTVPFYTERINEKPLPIILGDYAVKVLDLHKLVVEIYFWISKDLV